MNLPNFFVELKRRERKDLRRDLHEQPANDRIRDWDLGDLRFNPLWDPLRGDPRFEALVASLAPKQ